MGLYERLNELIVTINRTNVDTLESGKSLMEWIAERDRNRAIADILHQLAENATPKPERFSRNEIRFVPTVDVRSVRKEADGYVSVLFVYELTKEALIMSARGIARK